MTKQKVKGVTIYRDSQGGEHETAEAAERENDLIEAREEFAEAARKLSKAYLGTAVTGCGRQFDTMSSGHYWNVRRYVQQRPIMRRVWIWPHACDAERDGDNVRYRGAEIDDDGRRETIDVLIGNLYATEKAAQKRYLELWREYATEVADELVEMEARLK